MIQIVGALIAAVAAIAAAWITAAQGRKISETHKQVSENSHRNDKPTVLDLISEMRDEQRETQHLLIRHLEWHSKGEN